MASMDFGYVIGMSAGTLLLPASKNLFVVINEITNVRGPYSQQDDIRDDCAKKTLNLVGIPQGRNMRFEGA